MITFQKNVLSFFGSGLSPWAPGTAGSFAAWAVAWLVGFRFQLEIGMVCLILGTICCYFFLKQHSEESDPSWIVIDEAAAVFLGMGCLQLFFPSPYLWQTLFFLGIFRVFDIFKPWPISWIENTLKGSPLKGAFGIMVDDIIAGLFALIVCFFAFHMRFLCCHPGT